MRDIVEQRFINDSGLHIHYEIYDIYNEIYISNGESYVPFTYEDVEKLAKVLTDFAKDV